MLIKFPKMFESFFENLGKKVSKNSGKIIVIWIAIIVIMSYGALLVFSHTNFNITNGFGSSNTMSGTASSQLDKYFPSVSTSGPGSSNSLIIVTQNISVQTANGVGKLVELEKSLNSTLSKSKNYTGVQSILTTENTTLSGFTKGMYKLYSANYGVVGNLNDLGTAVNASANIFLGVEEIYSVTFAVYYQSTASSQYSETAAYSNTISEIHNSTNPLSAYASVLDTFTNIFSKYVNATTSVSATNINSTVQNGSIGASQNSSFVSEINACAAKGLEYSFLKLSPSVIALQNFTQWMEHPVENNVAELISIFQGEAGAALNSTLSLFTTDNTTLHSVALESYLLSQPATSFELKELSLNLTSQAVNKEFYGNPIVVSNQKYVFPYLSNMVNYTESQNSHSNATLDIFSTQYLNAHAFYQMPVGPSNYLYHSFVGYKYSTTMFIFTFSGNYSTALGDQVSSIAHNVTTAVPGSKVLVAGTAQMASQLEGEIMSGLVKALGAGIVLSILIVGLFFRSLKAAFMPIIMFMAATIVSLGILGYMYTFVLHTEASFITPTLLLIFVLGLSSDYTVYMMSRYRHEIRKKADHPTIVSSRWAGHAIFTSGLTVVLSEVALWLANVPFFSDSGFANAIGVAVTLIVANTLLLSILHRYGKRIFKKDANAKTAEVPHPIMDRAGKFSTKHKTVMIVVFVVIALIGLTVYSDTPSGIDILKLLPSSQAITAIEVVNNTFDGDFFERGYMVVQLPQPLITSNNHYNSAEMSTIYSIENRTLDSKGISQVYGPGRPFGNYTGYMPSNVPASQLVTYVNQSNSFISKINSSYVEIVFQTSDLGWGTNAINAVTNVYPTISNTTGMPSTYKVEIGGTTEQLSDSLHVTRSSFNELLPILAITIFLILLIQLSSALTPIRLVLMVLAAVLVSLSISYVIFHYIQGLPVVIFMPVFVFITLLAVGVDYDVFMITRVREEVMKGETLKDAIHTSVAENGGVIMLLGTLLFVTFAALYLSAIPLIQEIGIGVGLGVLIDTFISWPFFIPAIMTILGKKNWWPSKIAVNKK